MLTYTPSTLSLRRAVAARGAVAGRSARADGAVARDREKLPTSDRENSPPLVHVAVARGAKGRRPERSGVPGMTFEIGGGSPDPGP